MKTLTITINIPLSDDAFEQAETVARSKILPDQIRERMKEYTITGTVTHEFVTKREKKTAQVAPVREAAE